jgi:hypothetical protein
MRPVIEQALLRGGPAGLDTSAVRQVWERFLARETSWTRPWSLFVLQRWCEQNL